MERLSYIALAIVLFTMAACTKTNQSTDTEIANATYTLDTMVASSSTWEDRYVAIPATEIQGNSIDLIGNQWMLVTAGNEASNNTMTAAWGALGMAWGHPSAFIMIRESRYTYEFLQREQAYTLSFFDEEYRSSLRICGTQTGRTEDKVKNAGLTPVSTPSGLMTFSEARMVIECRNMYQDRLDTEHLTPAYQTPIVHGTHYDTDPSRHQLFISEITRVWVRK